MVYMEITVPQQISPVLIQAILNWSQFRVLESICKPKEKLVGNSPLLTLPPALR